MKGRKVKISKRQAGIILCMAICYLCWVPYIGYTEPGVDRLPLYTFIVFPAFTGNTIAIAKQGRIEKQKDYIFVLLLSVISGFILIGYCILHIPQIGLWGIKMNLSMCAVAGIQIILSVWELFSCFNKRK